MRPLVRHACQVMRELHELREGGRISWDAWLASVTDVTSAVDQGIAVRAEDRPAVTAAALPGEPDSSQLRAAEHVGLFPYADAADRDSVKGHAA